MGGRCGIGVEKERDVENLGTASESGTTRRRRRVYQMLENPIKCKKGIDVVLTSAKVASA